jgi:hypothetical protein
MHTSHNARIQLLAAAVNNLALAVIVGASWHRLAPASCRALAEPWT